MTTIITILIGLIPLIIFYLKLKQKERDIITEKAISLNNKLNLLKEEYNNRAGVLRQAINEQELYKKRLEDQNEEIVKRSKQNIDWELANYRLQKTNEMEDYLADEQLKVDKAIAQIISNKQEIIDKARKDIKDFREKRDAVNEAILREKEIQENQSFYMINIPEDDREDIQRLQELAKTFNKREAIYKLIYDVYVKRPLEEMKKRVLDPNKPIGIYKITYVPTGESYIGRSLALSRRLSEHLKTACGLDGAAKSSIHRKMQEEGIWNFSFEVLEYCDRENVNDREHFYIELYNTKTVGFNIVR